TRDQTALMWAAAQGHTEVVKVLLEAGADLNARSTEVKAFHEGRFTAGRRDATLDRTPMLTPLLFAVRGGHIATTEALLDAGADVNGTTPNGTPALHLACINAHWELAAILARRGADLKVQSPGGTALHHIIRVRAAKVHVQNGEIPPPEPTGSMSSV